MNKIQKWIPHYENFNCVLLANFDSFKNVALISIPSLTLSEVEKKN